MRRRQLIYAILLICLVVAGCKKEEEKKIDWSVSLDKNDKKPYGAHLAYESLKYYFPAVKIDALSQGFRYSNIDDEMKNEKGVIVLILSGLNFHVSEEELERLVTFAEAGNEILLFCSSLDNKLEEKLGCYKASGMFAFSNEEQEPDKANTGAENLSSLSFASDTNKKYGFQGRHIRGWFSLEEPETDSVKTDSTALAALIGSGAADTNSIDTTESEYADSSANTDTSLTDEEYYDQYEEDEEDVTGYVSEYPEILGYTGDKPNFVRYEVGRGHITLHAAPLAISNYFLLQENNLSYIDGIWNSLPGNVTHIYWNSYYKHRAEHSDFSILWKNPATRWALWLSIITLCLYVLLELKRRQAPIAIVTPLENTSVTFVETVGRLYYNKGNHRNLAEKMIQHYLEWVRTHYYLNTNQLNEIFVQQLANKSGLPIEVAANLVEMIHEIRLGSANVDEAYLYHLNNTIQRFYKKP